MHNNTTSYDQPNTIIVLKINVSKEGGRSVVEWLASGRSVVPRLIS